MLTVPPSALSLSILLSAAAVDNAADDYVAASKLYKEPDDVVSETLENWPEGAPAPAGLPAVLSDNRSALESLVAGTRKPRCDFAPKTSVHGLGSDVPSVPLLKLGKILVLRGRALQERGELEPALADYLGAFKLLGHLGRTESVETRVVSTALEHFIASMVEPSAKGAKLKRRLCTALAGHLESHLTRRPPAVGMVEIERRQALALGKTIAASLEKRPDVAAAFTKEFAHRVDAYFDPFSRYGKSHKPEDKTRADQAAQRLKAEVTAKKAQFEAIANKISQDGAQDQRKLMEEIVHSERIKLDEIPTAIATLMMGIVAVDLTYPIDTHFQATEALEKLRSSMAACR